MEEEKINSEKIWKKTPSGDVRKMEKNLNK